MPRPDAPCKDCPDRKSGCHSVCEKYITYRVELEKYNKMRDEKMKIASYAIQDNKRRR